MLNRYVCVPSLSIFRFRDLGIPLVHFNVWQSLSHDLGLGIAQLLFYKASQIKSHYFKICILFLDDVNNNS